MNEIKVLIEIARHYNYCGRYPYAEHIDEGNHSYNIYHNEHYDEHYRVCYEAATNFINTSPVFSKLVPEEIIKAFTNMEFKDNRIFASTKMSILYTHRMLMNHSSDHLKLFEELLRINQEMLVALIKAINARTITYERSYYFVDMLTETVGARQDVPDDQMIELYRKLLEHNYFDVENLNIPNIINEIRPTRTKRAV